MTEQPAAIAREAKGIHQSLKELLKIKEPFDKEVDFQRKNLRRRYLILLLVHPDAKESKDVENHLWMQTSYAFISSYKQRIAALDRIIQNNQRQQQQGQGQQQPRQNGTHGVVEHRKLVQRFRQFLADEEKFWTQVVLRLRRLFDLKEAQPALITLGLLSERDDGTVSNLAAEASETREGVMHGASGRNHFQFPPEDPKVSFVPSTAEERESRMAILSKALICLGDIARYRELYNESQGRRAGHEDGPPRRGRSRRGGAAAEIPPRPRNYDKARQCYEQARLLVPYEGNPSHQLAILSSYQKDSFASLIHYYRALCVSQPYDTAAENLGTVLFKALDTWRQRNRRERDRNGTNDLQLPPRVRIDNFKERVVVLHALWRVGMEKGIEKMKSISPKHNEKVSHDFYSLVSERHLPIDMISNTVVLSQGALWKHRMIRDNTSSSHRKADSAPVQPGTATLIEWGLLDHLMDMHLVLLEVGKDELKDPPQMEGVDDLAQRISATFRRTLPALRIASKWLRANYKYVMQDQEFIAFKTKESTKGVEVTKHTQSKISGYSSKTLRFWKTYAQFMLALSQAFPVNKLPVFNAPLEEDVEMKGFLPLRKLMGEEKKDNLPADAAPAREQPHPNVEQLMRIYDLLEDAKALVQMENSPLMMANGHILFDPGCVEDVRPQSHPEIMQSVVEPPVVLQPQQQQLLETIRDTSLEINPKQDPDADDMTELTSRTDDELVRDAFNHLNEPETIEDEDEQEDEIVWDPRATISPVLSPHMHATPLTPVKPLLSPTKPTSPKSPVRKPPFTSPANTVQPSVTTAQDLLNDVLNFTARPLLNGNNLASSVESISTAPQPPLLFGSELSHRTNPSIWSASMDEQPLMFTSNSGGVGHNIHGASHTYQTTPQRQFAPTAPDLSQQSIWSSQSSFPSQTQSSQQSLIGALPSAPLALPPQTVLPTSSLEQRPPHQRIPSSSLGTQLFQPMPSHLQHDPFGYPAPIQPPLQKTGHLLGQLGQSNLGFDTRSQLAQGGFLGGGVPAEYYATSNASGYHTRQASMHDPRVAPPSFLPPQLSQMWGNTG